MIGMFCVVSLSCNKVSYSVHEVVRKDKYSKEDVTTPAGPVLTSRFVWWLRRGVPLGDGESLARCSDVVHTLHPCRREIDAGFVVDSAHRELEAMAP